MSVEMLVQTGRQIVSNGMARLRGARDGALVAQDDFAAAVEDGNVFGVCNQAGATMAAGLSLTTPLLTLANPAGSGVHGRLWYAGFVNEGIVTAAGSVLLAAGTNTIAAVVTGTLTTAHRNLKLGGLNAQGNKIVPFTLATLPAVPVAVALLGVQLTGALTTVPGFNALGRWFNGSIMIEPGCNLSIQSLANINSAGLAEFIWEEVQIQS